jgi:hypothetical protein
VRLIIAGLGEAIWRCCERTSQVWVVWRAALAARCFVRVSVFVDTPLMTQARGCTRDRSGMVERGIGSCRGSWGSRLDKPILYTWRRR